MRSAWSGKSLMQSWWMSLAARRADLRASILLKSAAVMRSCPSKHSTMRRAVSAGELDGQYQLVWCLRKWEMERVMVPYWRLVSAGRVEMFRVGPELTIASFEERFNLESCVLAEDPSACSFIT